MAVEGAVGACTHKRELEECGLDRRCGDVGLGGARRVELGRELGEGLREL